MGLYFEGKKKKQKKKRGECNREWYELDFSSEDEENIVVQVQN